MEIKDTLVRRRTRASVPIVPLTKDAVSRWVAREGAATRRWLEQTGFEAAAGQFVLLHDPEGYLTKVVAGVERRDDTFGLAHLATRLPAGDYYLDPPAKWPSDDLERAALGWALGAYRFDSYRSKPAPKRRRLCVPSDVDWQRLTATVESTWLVRDLVNTPAEDMLPSAIGAAAAGIAKANGARIRQTVGDTLLKQNYPAIHAVGRAADDPPRLIDIRWGKPGKPRVTLVGKGVCFDSGGLNIKPSGGMRMMKKDMGGAAHVLGLANLIMRTKLPVSLRVLVPAVENAISGNAYRPGDVLQTRAGITVEVDNTDAEGRIVLCDALAEAASETPECIVDFATLTGAARVALGTELPAMFCNDDALASELLAAGAPADDPVWRLPLHEPYRAMLDSTIADTLNTPPGGFGGAITAALFLDRFVPKEIPWVHYDIMAWNVRALPGRPIGGEAMGMRTTFAALAARYG